MILHIFNNWVFTLPYIKFIDRNYNGIDHQFFIIKSSGKLEVPKGDNIKNFVIRKNDKKRKVKAAIWKFYTYISLFLYCLKSDRIILHSLSDKSIIKFFFLNPWFSKKLNWVIWGADLHYDKYPKNTLSNKMNRFMKLKVIKNLGSVTGLTPGDISSAKEKFRFKAREFDGMYINTVGTEHLDRIVCRNKTATYIQIGNSADPSNSLIESLEILKKFKDENIKIFAPLTYGNEDYANKVKDFGEKIFGEKFVPIVEFMRPEEYSNFLGEIDILVYNHKRQQGLGNIYSLIYLGKKVFIRRDTTSWDFFINKLGITLHDTLVIRNMNFSDFIRHDVFEVEKNKKRSEETFYSDKYIKNLWDKIFRGGNL